MLLLNPGRNKCILGFILFLFVIIASTSIGYAAPRQKRPSKAEETKSSPAPVVFDKKTLFFVQAKVLSFSPEERAKLIEERIIKLSRNALIPIDKITTIDGEMSTDIAAGDLVIMTVTDGDAEAAGKNRSQMAREYASIVRAAIDEERYAYSAKAILLGAVFSVLVTLLFIFGFIFINKVFLRIGNVIESWKGVRIPSFKFQKLEIFSSEQIGDIIISATRLLRITIVLFGCYVYIASVLQFFPWTRNLSSQIVGYITAPITAGGNAFISYLPDFFVLCIISVITYYGLKLIKIVFSAIGKGILIFPGFYREWAEPTYAIIRFLVISFAAVVAFPYLPGSESPAFKGVSIFIGVLFSLGSTSAIANVVAGIIITYMRAFKIGDRVKISDATGDVTEKSLLITRLRTIKNENITIPNSMVLGSHIINYSSTLQPGSALILHTSVTIGYDAPWRKVHELLIAAANKTSHILLDPPPFVLQTALDDFYVRYELNAYTDAPSKMASIYSELHQNIQDRFNEGGVEIMSPHYANIRDGNQTTIPEGYLPESYRPPAFRVSQTGERPDEKI